MFNLDHPNGLEYTPWFKRFGAVFPGKVLPFGCRVDYWLGPKAKRAKDGLDRFSPTSEPGVFLGYHFPDPWADLLFRTPFGGRIYF